MRSLIEQLRAAWREANRRPLFGHWFGHNATRVLIGAMVAWIVWTAVGALVTLPTWVDRPVGTALLLLVTATPAAMVDHAQRLCPKVIEGMPLDPGTQAEQWHRYLAYFHYQYDHRVKTFAVTLAYLGVVFSLWHFGILPLVASFPLTILPQLVDSLVTARHQQVQLWCPRCRHGGQGKREWVPEPMPGPALVAH
jgi:hypothetical protein